MVRLICFRLEIPFLGKFGSKTLNCQFRLKFGTYTNSKIQNSIGIFTFLGFDPKHLFLGIFRPKIQICLFRETIDI